MLICKQIPLLFINRVLEFFKTKWILFFFILLKYFFKTGLNKVTKYQNELYFEQKDNNMNVLELTDPFNRQQSENDRKDLTLLAISLHSCDSHHFTRCKL